MGRDACHLRTEPMEGVAFLTTYLAGFLGRVYFCRPCVSRANRWGNPQALGRSLRMGLLCGAQGSSAIDLRLYLNDRVE